MALIKRRKPNLTKLFLIVIDLSSLYAVPGGKDVDSLSIGLTSWHFFFIFYVLQKMYTHIYLIIKVYIEIHKIYAFNPTAILLFIVYFTEKFLKIVIPL